MILIPRNKQNSPWLSCLDLEGYTFHLWEHYWCHIYELLKAVFEKGN